MTQFKTLQFPNTAKGQANKIRALELETANGWRVVSETIVPGKFKGAQACCLFLIFAPCAFLAGHDDDIITITLEKEDFSDTADLQAASSSLRTPSPAFDHARWNALLEYDQEIRAAAEPLRKLDPKWMEEFGSAYMVLSEKQYLAEIVRRILERVRLEEAEKEQLRQLDWQRAEAVRERSIIEEQARERVREARKQRFALLLNLCWGSTPRKILTIGAGLAVVVVVSVIGERSLRLHGRYMKAPIDSTKETRAGQQQSAAPPNVAKYLDQQVTVLTAPTAISWSAKTDGDPKTYRIGDLNITLSSRPSGTDKIPIPVIQVGSSGNFSPIEVAGEGSFDVAAAELLVGQLDPTNPENDVMFLTYTGGAHCCTDIKIIQAMGTSWKSTDIGSWDSGELSAFPKDIDGDHIPDIVLYDGRFNYAFASYADSYAPPLIFNLVGGSVLDVSTNPRYSKFFRQVMTREQAGCLLHQNGACAAFVAVASRIDLHDYAWRFMLSYYDRNDTWALPKSCDVAKINDNCPNGHEITPADFPSALANFLAENDYYDPTTTHQDEPVGPSFSCAAVHSQVLTLVCNDPELGVADQDLAAAYIAALATNSSPDNLKRDEQSWISRRNNSHADTNTLLRIYEDRISVLTRMANEGTGSNAR